MGAIHSPLNDEFLLTLVHDLRAYVRKSLSGTQLIERSFASPLESSIQQRFEQVIDANKDLDKFLSRLSDYAGAGNLRKSRPLPLFAVIQTAAAQFPLQLIDLAPAAEAKLKISVPQEAVRLFAELFDNALKFSKNAPVSIDIDSQVADTTTVKIFDNGIGIPLGKEEHVFDLLVRLESNDEFPGFGLGLPICRRVADSVGAQVTLAANPAGGTVASVAIFTAH